MLAAACPKAEGYDIKARRAVGRQVSYFAHNTAAAPCRNCLCSAWHDKQSMGEWFDRSHS